MINTHAAIFGSAPHGSELGPELVQLIDQASRIGLQLPIGAALTALIADRQGGEPR